ncbi:MAG: RluA family pseudouridine synthase [Pseudomonadota bacterium]
MSETGGNNQIIEVPQTHHQMRLDKVLAELLPDLSRSRIKALILDGQVTINKNVKTTASFKVDSGNKIHIEIPEAVDDTPKPENILLDIVYEDDDVIVINKSANMVVHPAIGHLTGTLVNAILYHCGDSLSGIGGVKRPGIVHRLDRETSGLIVVAKNDNSHNGLSEQLKDRSLSRVYTSFAWKSPNLIKGYVDEPIGRHATNRIKMAVMKSSGREAKTHYMVTEKYGHAASQIECKLESGRTHQIRVHMQHLKNPIIGDPLYGLVAQEAAALLKRDDYDENSSQYILNFPRQALHAQKIGFIHPASGEEMAFEVDMPEDMQNLKNHLKSIP